MSKGINYPSGLTRRRFLQVSSVAAGGLILGACADDARARLRMAPSITLVSRRIRILQIGVICLHIME